LHYKPRTKPFKHQAQATLNAVRQRNHAIFFEPRLGKSKAALDYVGILALKGEVSRVLILAPRIALDVWQGQIEQHFPYYYEAETYTEEWSGHKLDPLIKPVQFFLAGREETFRATRDKRGKLHRPKQKELEEWRPDAIILDESHEYKRPGGRGAQDAWRMVRRLRQRSTDQRPYALLLSGTPNPKGWRDLFAQYRIMDESLLGTSASDFDEEYCVYGQGARKYTIIKYRNLSRLQRTIHDNSTTCTAEQAGLEGKLWFEPLHVQLPQRVRSIYAEMAEEFAVELGGEVLTAKNQGVKRLRLLQITGGFTTSGKQIHRAKVEKLRDWLRMLHSQGECVVVGARFLPEVRACGLVTTELGFDTAVISGSTPHDDRSAAIRAFQKASQPSAMVFQVQAGSRSIELSRAAEVVFYSLPDGWVDFWQFLNRVRGPNQKRPVRVSALVARGSVDVSVLTSLRGKEDVHRTMMRDPRRYLTGGYSDT
jgi:hypothetical protein